MRHVKVSARAVVIILRPVPSPALLPLLQNSLPGLLPPPPALHHPLIPGILPPPPVPVPASVLPRVLLLPAAATPSHRPAIMRSVMMAT